MSRISAIELRSVSKVTPNNASRRVILKNVSIRFQPGCLNILKGPSGAGKSTLLSIAGFLSRPDDGQVVAGAFTSHANASERDLLMARRSKIAFLFQSAGLVESLSVHDNVCLPLWYQPLKAAERQARVTEALETFDLLGMKAQLAAGLSGGERHRVALARLMAQGTDWLICDEPTTGLDAPWVGRILDALSHHVARGAGVLVASHDDRLISHAERLYVLADQSVSERL